MADSNQNNHQQIPKRKMAVNAEDGLNPNIQQRIPQGTMMPASSSNPAPAHLARENFNPNRWKDFKINPWQNNPGSTMITVSSQPTPTNLSIGNINPNPQQQVLPRRWIPISSHPGRRMITVSSHPTPANLSRGNTNPKPQQNIPGMMMITVPSQPAAANRSIENINPKGNFYPDSQQRTPNMMMNTGTALLPSMNDFNSNFVPQIQERMQGSSSTPAPNPNSRESMLNNLIMNHMEEINPIIQRQVGDMQTGLRQIYLKHQAVLVSIINQKDQELVFAKNRIDRLEAALVRLARTKDAGSRKRMRTNQ